MTKCYDTFCQQLATSVKYYAAPTFPAAPPRKNGAGRVFAPAQDGFRTFAECERRTARASLLDAAAAVAAAAQRVFLKESGRADARDDRVAPLSQLLLS